MAVFAVILFVVIAGFALVLIATVLVIIGVHQEERRKSVVGGHRPPTPCALLARWVLGAHFYLIPEEWPESGPPEDELPWFARPQPPSGPIGPRERS
jgi:hypothetical protein